MTKRGRPNKYTEALAEEICERLADGETLTRICDEDHMPTRRSIINWCRDVEGFSSRYARARADQRELWADEIIDIADDGRNDWMEKASRDGTIVVLNKEAISRSALRAASRQWLLARLNRDVYGDKVTQEVKGADGQALAIQIVTGVQRDGDH